jgi:predicted dehydrogenase
MVRFGILGFGHHAAKRLVAGFAGAKDVKLVGFWRRDKEKAEASAKEFSISHIFESPEALCASPEIDAVFVASPDALHIKHTLIAAQFGKHILCEKPMAMNAGEVERMLAAAERMHVKLGVAQNMRYNRSLEVMRDWIAEGRIGKPQLAQAQFAYAAARSPRVWIYNPDLAAGGPIGDVGIHCIDALRFIFGSDETTHVRAVTTLARMDSDSCSVESHAVVGLDFASGAMGSVTVTTRSAYRTLIEVTGEHGVIRCENGLTVDFPVDVVARRGSEILASETVSNADAYSRMLDGFAGCVEGREKYRAPGRDGLHNQRLLDAAYTSWRDGARVKIK